jgi:hypothetical protein
MDWKGFTLFNFQAYCNRFETGVTWHADLLFFKRQKRWDYGPSAGIWVEFLGNLYTRPMFFCCYFCHEAEIRYQDVSFPTLVFVKAMSPILAVAPGGTASDIVTQLEHRQGPQRAWRPTAYMGHWCWYRVIQKLILCSGLWAWTTNPIRKFVGEISAPHGGECEGGYILECCGM